MRKTTYVSRGFVSLFLFFLCFNIVAQTYEPFTIRENLDVRGSMLVIGNNILSESNQPFNDNNADNQDINMQYIDIDGDASTFSSSSSDLILPNHEDGSSTDCYRVAYAALYWGAFLQDGSRTNINRIKLKTPASSAYADITGEIVYDAIASPIVSEPNEPGNTPYACYADITDIMSSLGGIEGTYTVADVLSSEGFNNSTGLSAGWTLLVIYEDPELQTKSFTTFDGFSHLYDGQQLIIPVTGFRTPLTGSIDLQFAYGALDGDRTKRANKLEINGKEVTTPLRGPANRFFGSIIENTNLSPVNAVTYPRNPFNENTLGYDTGFLEIKDSEPEYIKNNVTSTDFRLQVAKGQADPIYAFFSAFAVDIIAPKIDLTKIVIDTAGDDIGGEEVDLGQRLFYEITYQSTGNDNVTQFTIKDVLPENVIFNPNTDIDLTNAGGATLQSYDPVTRTLIFNIPDASVEINDPKFTIRLAVQVVPNCYDLSQACSNEILNQAFATYRGVINPEVIQDEGSFASIECLGTPGATNFLVDISDCTFEKTEVLCGTSILLMASDGYESYSWSTSPTGTPVIETGQTYTATQPGTYYVTNTAPATCLSIREQINVITYGADVTNPVIPFADLLPICPNDGKVLPYIFLCGANDTRVINTGISDAVSIIWEKLDETSCAAVTVDDCANEDPGCTWNQVTTGPNYTANDSGQFRMVINYPGGCFNIFYFNVYQNLLSPTISAKDILCTTPGEITVGGVPSGYEYSLEGTNYQSSNVFPISTPDYYTVYIRQIGVNTNPCIFQTPSIYVRQRDFTVSTVVTQPFCNGEKGSISLAANNAFPQYYYSIYLGSTLVNSVGPIMASDYTFANLNPGNYTVNISTDDGCTYSEDIEIVEPPLLTATVALTLPLTCNDGEITVYPNGGTPPYIYYVNGATDSQDSPIIPVTAPGIYNITVLDSNNCSTNTSIQVDAIPAPDFTISKTDILCSDDSNGSININVTNPNGNTLEYSIDNGVTFFNSPVFNGLVAGDYEVVVQYSSGADVCISTPQTITINIASAISGIATLTTPYTCTTNGVITVSGVTGGTAPYTYSLDGINFQNGLTFSGLTDGTYTVTIRDANNCAFLTAPIIIDPLDPSTGLTFSNTPITCPTITSDVTVTSTGGTAPLEYQIIAPSGATTAYQASNIFTGLAPNTYTFRVRDANDCIYTESYTIAPLTPLTITTVITKDIDCTISPDGIITGDISGGTAPFSYQVSFDGGAYATSTAVTGTTFTFTAANDGTYQFLITDANSCTVESGVQTISAPVLVTASNTTINPTCNGFSDGSIRLRALTGQGPFTYSIDGGATFVTSNVFGGLVAGNYNYVIRDSKSCEATGIINLVDPAPIDVTVNRNPVQCSPSVLGSLDLTINSGGIAPFVYSLYDDALHK